VDQQNCLGIHLGKQSANVALLTSHGGHCKVQDCFCVHTDASDSPDEEQQPQSLGRLIAAGCKQRAMTFSEVALALDASLFMEHNLRSEFNDERQIAHTIKFDAEEALATDASEMAIAFSIIAKDESGSRVRLYAAQQKMLLKVLADLQNNGLEPTTIQPDIVCLAGLISRAAPEQDDSQTLLAVLSHRTGYLIDSSKSKPGSIARTFLLNPSQNRTELLAREIPMTLALAKQEQPPNRVLVFDATDSVNTVELTDRLGIPTAAGNLLDAVEVDPDILDSCDDVTGFVIACGAGLSQLTKARKVDFRPDFMPYQGKKIRMEKALKLLSISVTVLVLAIGLYFQLRLVKLNSYRSELRTKMSKQYSAVMFGKKMPTSEDPVKKLKRALARIRDVKAGQLTAAGENSVSALLVYVLEVLNTTPARVDLQIDSISVTPKAIIIVGSTNSRANTIELFKTIDKHEKLKKSQSNYDTKAGRDKFRATIIPEKS